MKFSVGQRAFVKEVWAQEGGPSGQATLEVEIVQTGYVVKNVATNRTYSGVDEKYLFPTREEADASPTITNKKQS